MNSNTPIFPDVPDLSSQVKTQTVSEQSRTMEHVGDHTSGPYFPVQVSTGMWEVVVSESQYAPAVAYLTSGTYLPNGTSEANAKLLAAAPDMLEALQDIQSDLVRLIQNSEGIMGLMETDHNPGWAKVEFECLSSMVAVKDAIAKATGKETP